MEVISPGAPPDTLLSTPTNVDDFGSESGLFDDPEFSSDVRELEERLEEAEGEYSASLPGPSGPRNPGDDLRPSEKFWRVPIRPYMSDANWVRWAGPMVDKEYRVHRGDSLWKVSERLFGTPFLWPKIWHLNAEITNPHIIEKGMTLSFRPGNPGSAPQLAYKAESGVNTKVALYPLQSMEKEYSMLEMIDATIREQLNASHPPFQSFLLYNKPEILGQMPEIANRSGQVFFREGESFPTKLPDGKFPISSIENIRKGFATYFRVHWIGNLEVENNRATVTKVFREIKSGDYILNRSFRLTPLAVHEETLGPELRKKTHLVSLQQGAERNIGTYNLVGVQFPDIGIGPRPGAILTLNVGQGAEAKALLIDRDQKTGTLWVLRAEEELDLDDQFF